MNSFKQFVLLGFITFFSFIVRSHASEQDFKPIILYDLGGKYDKSFNEAAYNGAEMFTAETGLPYRDFEPSNETQFEQALKRFARRDSDLIIAIGVSYTISLRNVARRYPNKKFVVIDATINLPNVQSIVFKENEGSFLVGVLAAMASKSGKVGFIGGMDIPLIRRFNIGYEQGVKYAKPKTETFRAYVGTTPSAWSDPIKAGELAKSQYARGADVIFAPAGPSSLGVIQAAKDTGHLAIGTDTNQNHLAPGVVLTTMLKRVDIAVRDALISASKGEWKAGITVMTLKDGGVDYALDEHNKALITPAMKTAVEKARQDIISGAIKVDDINVNTGKH